MRCRQARYVALWTAVGLVSVLALATGCSLKNGFLDPTALGQFPGEFEERGIRRVLTAREAPHGRAGAEEPTPADLVTVYEDYRIVPGDIMLVTIYDWPVPGAPQELQLEVMPSGNMRIPEIGTVRVAGLTEQEVEDELKAQFRAADILPNPDIRAYAATRRGRTFTVRGSVGAAGVYPISDPDTRLLDVIGIVRDIGPNVPRLYIIRRDATDFSDALDGDVADQPTAPRREPAATEDEWVIPPPADDDEFQTTFSTELGLASAQPAPAERRPTREQLEEVLAPPRTPPATQPRDTGDPFEPSFPPLIFDPETGEVTRARPPAQQAPVEPPAEEFFEEVARDEEEGFDWDDVPEFELQQRVLEIDVRALLGGDSRYNVVIRPKDFIDVPIDTGIYYMMGEVVRPGVYAFSGRDITLKQAIASSGGLSPFAWPQRVEIIRHEPGTDKQLTIPVNLDAIFSGYADDVYLRNDDIVNVGTSWISPFLFVIRNSFRFTYGFGFVYDRNFADQDAVGPKINPETLELQRRQQRGLPF